MWKICDTMDIKMQALQQHQSQNRFMLTMKLSGDLTGIAVLPVVKKLTEKLL